MENEQTIEAMKARLSRLMAELNEPEANNEEAFFEITEQIAEVSQWLAENGADMNDETTNPIPEPMSNADAQRTMQRYCCSGCWSHLNTYNRPGKGLYVLCPDCGDKTPGYVSKSWVERRKAESHAEAYEAKRNLRDALPFLNETAKKSAEELLAEIGFEL
jgi:DNA-directed RNA polymerase subunit RPC12/RpoP